MRRHISRLRAVENPDGLQNLYANLFGWMSFTVTHDALDHPGLARALHAFQYKALTAACALESSLITSRSPLNSSMQCPSGPWIRTFKTVGHPDSAEQFHEKEVLNARDIRRDVEHRKHKPGDA